MTETNDVVYGEFEYVGDLPVVPAARLLDREQRDGVTMDAAHSTEAAGEAPMATGETMTSAGAPRESMSDSPIDQVRELAERAVHVARDVASSVTVQPVALPFGLGRVPVPSLDVSRLDLETAGIERARHELGALALTARGRLLAVADDARRSVDSTARLIRDKVRS